MDLYKRLPADLQREMLDEFIPTRADVIDVFGERVIAELRAQLPDLRDLDIRVAHDPFLERTVLRWTSVLRHGDLELGRRTQSVVVLERESDLYDPVIATIDLEWVGRCELILIDQEDVFVDEDAEFTWHHADEMFYDEGYFADDEAW